MVCSNCGTENPPGRKFCGACGQPLAIICPVCGTPNEPRFAFCGECGSALTGSEAPAADIAPLPTRASGTRGRAPLRGHLARDGPDVLDCLVRCMPGGADNQARARQP